MHVCPMVTPGVPPIPHVGGPILPAGAPTVLIGMLPAARVTDMAMCVGPPDVIVKGSMTVLIGSLPAARIGDMTAHGGTIVLGEMTVMIGDSGSGGAGGGGGSADRGVARGSDIAGGGEMAPAATEAVPDIVAGVLLSPIVSAFSAAAKSGTALICKGPCAGCGQM